MKRVALMAILLVAGCASLPPPPLGIAAFEWEPDPDRPVCTKVEWVKVSWDQMAAWGAGIEAVAGLPIVDAAGRRAGMEVGCQVFSGYSEADARALRIPGTTETIYAHEARHVLERLRHPDVSRGARARQTEWLMRGAFR